MTDSWAGRKRRLRVPRWPSAICKSFLCFLCAATPRFTLGIVYPPFDSFYMTTLNGHKEGDVLCGEYHSGATESLYPSNGRHEVTYCGAGGLKQPCGASLYRHR